jgi:aromatic amino acid aminotransferase I
MWLDIDHTKHPNASTRSIEDIEAEIFDSCIDKGVLVARGSWFLTEKDKPLPGLHFRTTFASASDEQMSIAIQRFGEAVKNSFGMK